MDKIVYYIVIMLLVISNIVLACLLSISKEESTYNDSDSITIKLEQPYFFLKDVPNDSLVIEACKYYGIHHEDIVLKQAILETGHYRSRLCKEYNNLFGLYNSSKQEYFKFSHWTESVEAYKNKIQYKYKDNEDYYNFLERINYSEDNDYIKLLKGL